MKQKQFDSNELVKQVLDNLTESFEELKENYDWQLGIDEAGRGPVLGPMLYASCFWPIKYHQLISEICKFVDSKQINEATRDRLFFVICQLKNKILNFETRELTAEYLSKNQQAFLATNLNEISHNTAAELIQSAIKQGFRITQIYVDTVGPKLTYRNFLLEKLKEFGKVANVVVEEKADSKYPNVSAASICAKVTRDNKIKSIQKEIMPDGSIGSGYPGDPKTKKYLERTNIPFFVYPKYIRFSWQTIQKILNDRHLNIEYEEEQETSKQIGNLQTYFQKTNTNNYNYRSLTISNCIL